MRRADRLFAIVQYLRGRRLTTAAQLAHWLEVSERTIYRDIADLAAFYAGANAPVPSLTAPDPALVAAGQQLAMVGNAAKAVPACNNCHGPGGAGLPPTIPPLASQFAPYVVSELQLWQRGIRKNDGGAQMSDLVQRLDERDIAAVAAYYQQVKSALPASAVPAK